MRGAELRARGQSECSDDVFDVVIVGSGAGGMTSALRAAEMGLTAVILEKERLYGGTSATSGGGLWIPNHGLDPSLGDTREKAIEYLRTVSRGDFRLDRLEAFVDNGSAMLSFMAEVGIDFDVFPGFPDYFPDKPGAVAGRAVFPRELDAEELGDHFWHLREAPFVFRLFNRYTLDLAQSFALSSRPPGWRMVAVKIFAQYWGDIRWRRKTRRDRRLTMGNALIGRLRKALGRRDVPVVLNARMTEFIEQDGRVTGIKYMINDQPRVIIARHAVILASGGFEQNQALRDTYLPVPTNAAWSLTPKGGNVGDGLHAGQKIGAATEFLEHSWWAPSMRLPSLDNPNIEVTHQMFFDHRHPNSLCVNRSGKRFVNESCSYDSFGIAMIEDQQRNGGNLPCWMIFDADYRDKYTAGGLMPTMVTADKDVPAAWWDSYVYRATTVRELAVKIDVDPESLAETVMRFNGFASSGVDEDFGRGVNEYDRYFGDARSVPNPCMGSIARAPFYAIRVDLGDLGSKGGLKTDAKARVLDAEGGVIEGLYAVGNCAGSPFGDCYPGAGGTLGPATVFGFIAATEIAQEARLNTQAVKLPD